jgi:hypothetical protein
MPCPPTPKVRNWGDANKAILYELIRSGAVDIDGTLLANIKRVRQEHFQQRLSKNFRFNFCNYTARLDLEESYCGARQRAGEEGKLRICLLFVYFVYPVIYLPYAAAALPQPQVLKILKMPPTTWRRWSAKRRKTQPT